MGFPGGTSGKEPFWQCRRHRDVGSIPGLGRSPGEGHDNPLQYSCLENPMDRGACGATVHRVAKHWTQQLSTHAVYKSVDLTYLFLFHFCCYCCTKFIFYLVCPYTFLFIYFLQFVF